MRLVVKRLGITGLAWEAGSQDWGISVATYFIERQCMKFRKKPVVIEATQFWVNTPDGWPDGVYKDGTSPTGYRIDTLEGSHEVAEGDWIITGVKGERYPCKPEIFEMTYEPA